jgi:hypothetical protein
MQLFRFMRERRISPAVGLAIIALLAGCSAGTPPAAKPAAKATSASPTATAAAGTLVPSAAVRIRVGHFVFVQEFAASMAAGPEQVAVIQRFRDAQVLWEKSALAGKLVAPVSEYVTGQALDHLSVAISFAASKDTAPAGIDRMFMTGVTSFSASAATVTTCDDGSKYQSVDRKTGKVIPSLAAPPDQQYLLEAWQLAKTGGGWAISAFTVTALPSPSAKQCQPA